MVGDELDAAHRIGEARNEGLGQAQRRGLHMQRNPVRIGMVVEEAVDQRREARLEFVRACLVWTVRRGRPQRGPVGRGVDGGAIGRVSRRAAERQGGHDEDGHHRSPGRSDTSAIGHDRLTSEQEP
jgi:hypothetical protein